MKLSEVICAGLIMGTTGFLVSEYLAPKFDAARTPAASSETATLPPAPEPQPTATYSANSVQLRLENDGHYWASANVDGAHVRFMVDTGASTVALTFNDAQRIGLRPETLDFKWSIRTAGGEVKGASVLLKSIQIGRVEVENVEAMILRDGLDQSLLGMSFLSQLDSYEFRRGNLIMRQ